MTLGFLFDSIPNPVFEEIAMRLLYFHLKSQPDVGQMAEKKAGT